MVSLIFSGVLRNTNLASWLSKRAVNPRINPDITGSNTYLPAPLISFTYIRTSFF